MAAVGSCEAQCEGHGGVHYEERASARSLYRADEGQSETASGSEAEGGEDCEDACASFLRASFGSPDVCGSRDEASSRDSSWVLIAGEAEGPRCEIVAAGASNAAAGSEDDAKAAGEATSDPSGWVASPTTRQYER